MECHSTEVIWFCTVSSQRALRSPQNSDPEFTTRHTWFYSSWDFLQDTAKLEQTLWNFVMLQLLEICLGYDYHVAASVSMSQEKPSRTGTAIMDTEYQIVIRGKKK